MDNAQLVESFLKGFLIMTDLERKMRHKQC